MIHKQILRLADGFVKNELEVPYGAKFLTVQMQHNTPMLWYSFSPKAKTTTKRIVYCVGTGFPHDETLLGDYIGTVQEGNYVWHYFEGLK